MKKFVSVLIAVLMLSAFCVPALAGADTKDNEPLFDTEFTLVNNEPNVEYDDWGVPYYVWVPATEPYAIGDTVTLVLSYAVPDTMDGYDDVMLASIEYITTFTGLTGIELVEAVGCPIKLICDYELGYCMPVPGEYSNITLADDVCTVMAELGSEVQIVLRGVVTEETVTCHADITIGQYRFPAQFMIGTSIVTLQKYDEGFYKASRSDFNLVQKRSIAYRNNDNALCDMFAALNEHYYRAVIADYEIDQFIPVDENWEDCGDPIDKDGELFATLTSIMEEYKELFGICYCSAAVNDETFFDASLAESYSVTQELAPAGSDDPEDPTPTPGGDDPEESDEPAEPSPSPIAPITGAISLTAIGIASIAAGAGMLFARRRDD